jgi:hypothetical protein
MVLDLFALVSRFGDIMQPTPMDLSKLSPIKPDPNLSAMNHPVTP